MISRRAFLETAAAASLELFLAGCTPPQYERRDIPATEIKKESIKPLVDSLNMQEIAGFPLAADQSGINTTVLTDDREKISFDNAIVSGVFSCFSAFSESSNTISCSFSVCWKVCKLLSFLVVLMIMSILVL